MKNFLQIADGIDTRPLLLALARRPEVWREDTYLRSYPQGPFGAIDSVILRFPVRTVHETEEALRAHVEANPDQIVHECVDQPVFARLPEARPLIFGLMAMVQGERLGRVLINRINPDGRIDPHADTPIHADYWRRFHIVLQSKPPVYFRCGAELCYMPQGTAYWFNNKLEHEVRNDSDLERIHMVVDIRCSI